MIKFSLFLLKLLHKPIAWMGADYHQLRIILKTKLNIDFRRVPASMKSSGNKKQTFKKVLIFYCFLGLMIASGLVMIKDILLNYTIAYGILMVMVGLNLISEFTSVLFDPIDNQIILVRPVNNRTLLLSRLFHVLFYVMYIALALSLLSVIVTIFKYSLAAALLYFTGIMLCSWITVLLTLLFYFAISKVIKGEKFKDVIAYLQIALSIVVMGGYQLLPRMMELKGLKDFSMSIHNYTFLLPPAWLASLVKLSVPHEVNLQIAILALTALLFPLFGGIFLIRFLSGDFTAILAFSGEGSAQGEKKSLNKKSNPINEISNLLCVSKLEKIGWKLASIVMRRDRKFKQAIYPSYGLMLVMAFMLLKPNLNDLSGWYVELGNSNKYLFMIFLSFFTTLGVDHLKYTDTPECGWIYKALPVQSPGHILSGAIKAMLIKHFLPVYAILTILVSVVWGIDVAPLMFVGGALLVLSTLISAFLQNKDLPFTQPREMQQKTNYVIKMFVGFFIMGVIVGIVYLATMLPVWAVVGIGIIAIYCNSFAYSKIRQLNFE